MSEKLFIKEKAGILFGKESECNKFPLLNKIIAIYIGVTLIFQMSSLIAPVLTALSHTPLYSFKTYLGIIGAALIVADLFTNKALWRGRYCLILYSIAAVAVLSSLLTYSYGIKDNIFIICWTVIEIALFYSLSYRLDKKELKVFLFTVCTVLSAIWLVACCVSIWQFVTNVSYYYVADPLSSDSTSIAQGFMSNRLYGVFNPINHAAYISLMLSLSGIYFIITSKKIIVKICYGISSFVFLMHIILSGSRSALLAALIAISFSAYLLIRNKIGLKKLSKILISGVCTVLVAAICIGSYSLIKDTAAKIPAAYSELKQEKQPSDQESTAQNPSSVTAPGQTAPQPTTPTAPQTNILDRDLKEDTSNGRSRIWADYISLYKDIGLFGFSPGNYMFYVKENYNELYIVQQIKQAIPTKYEANIIYHVHNGYLMVFVATGFVGFALLLCYLLMCVARVLKFIYKNNKVSFEFITAFAIVLAGLVAAMFDRGIFLSDNAQTFVFWIAAGILMKHITPKDKNTEISKE